MADGYLSFCKACTKARIEKHRIEHIDEKRAADRERSKLPKRKEQMRALQRVYAAKYPDRKSARHKLYRAVRSGKVVQQPCFICGDAKSEAHHSHYDLPLSVTWLCKLHHEELHAAHG